MIRSHGTASADAASPADEVSSADAGLPGQHPVAPDRAEAAGAGPAPVPVTAEITMKKLADLARNELRRLARDLGEDVIGGHRHPRPDDRFHRMVDLQKIEKNGSKHLRTRLKQWSPPPGPKRVLLLVSLWSEAWHLLDYSLAYRTLEVAERAAAGFCRDAVAPQADQSEQGWEVAALRAVGQAMSLVTTDAALFKLINLSSAEGLKVAAEQAVQATAEIESALAALGPSPFQGEDADLLAEKLGEIEDVARQNNVFYAALVVAAEALIEFERWLDGAPRVTFGRSAAAAADRPNSDTEQALASINAAIGYFRTAQAAIGDWLILSRYEPWERLLVQIREVVAPSVPSAVSRVFVPNRASVRYIYPFAVEAGDTVADLLNEGNPGDLDRLKADLDRQFRAIGITVGDLKALEPTEFFTQGSGLYGGVRVDLPDLELRDQLPPGPGDRRQLLTAWLNLSSMGNHCLCIEPKEGLVEPLPHTLYRTLRAGTPFPIGATVALAGPPAPTSAAWDNLHFYSRDVITAAARVGFWCVDADLPVTQRFVRGNLHEIVVVRTEDPLGTRPPEIARALDRAVGGRILARSIQRAAATLEEWVRYPPVPWTGTAGQAAASAIDGIPEMGLEGDWCTHTGETTVFGIVSAPSWHSDIYVEGAQFANSWPPRLQLWSRRLRNIIESLEADSDHPEGPEQLRQVEKRVRLHLAQISTEELTATLAHRRFLDQLMGMAGLSGLQADLEAELEAAERLTDWFNQKARRSYEESRRADEDQRQKADARRQVLLGWIALFGLFELAGFLGLANSTDFRLGFISFTPRRASWEDWAILALLVLALLFGLYYYNNRVERLVRQLGSRVGTRRRKGHHEHPDTGPADPHGHEPHRGRLSGHSWTVIRAERTRPAGRRPGRADRGRQLRMLGTVRAGG
jgi:hypothetical protein